MNRVAAGLIVAVWALCLLWSTPAHAGAVGVIVKLIARLAENHPVLAGVLAAVVGLLFVAVVISTRKTGKKMKEKEQALLRIPGLIEAGKIEDAKDLCKLCFVEDWTGVYRGDLVVYDSKVLRLLMDAIEAEGGAVSPELAKIAAAFKSQAPKGPQAKVDLMDSHDELKDAVELA